MSIRAVGLGVALLVAGSGVAFAAAANAAASPQGLSCGVDADRASAEAIADFEGKPQSFIEGPAFVDRATLDLLSARVQALVVAKPALTASFLDLSQRTDDARRDAIGRGLRGASDLCAGDVKTERLGFQIQRDVAMSGSIPLVMAFSATKSDAAAPETADASAEPAPVLLDLSKLPESCNPKPAVATPAQVDAFLNDPPGLLSDTANAPGADAATPADILLVRRTRDLAVTSTRTIPPLVSLIPMATDPQKAAIGLGLAQAALFCGSDPVSAGIGLAIQQTVASLKDPTVLAAFLAGTNAIETAALAADPTTSDTDATTGQQSDAVSSPAIQVQGLTSNEAPSINNGEGAAAAAPAIFAAGGGGGFVPDPDSFFVNNDVSNAALTQ